MNIKERIKTMLNESKQTVDVPYKDYATPAFMKTVKDIIANGTMNMHVEEEINKKVSSKVLEKEINLAIRMHRKYDSQSGSSPLHSAVVIAMTRLLDVLRKSIKDFSEKKTTSG